jgi:hypothetical protein
MTIRVTKDQLILEWAAGIPAAASARVSRWERGDFSGGLTTGLQASLSPLVFDGSRSVPDSPAKKRSPVPYLAGGGFVAIVLLTVCMVVAGVSLRNRMVAGAPELSSIELTATALALRPTREPTPTPTPTSAPSPTATFSPPAPTAVNVDLPAVPEGVPFVRLTSIGLDSSGRYVVDYETFEINEALPGTHVHFYFGDAPLDSSGLPEKGSYIMYGGPHPFAELRAEDRPQEAVEICSLVASPEHIMQLNSGTCLPLPDLQL